MSPATNSVDADPLEDQFPGIRFEIPFEGSVPVQAWGTVGRDERFYFRWRGRNACLTVGPALEKQPDTPAESVVRMTGLTEHEVSALMPDAAPREGEIYPDGLTLHEETPADDNLSEASAVFRILFLRYELHQRHQERTPGGAAAPLASEATQAR